MQQQQQQPIVIPSGIEVNFVMNQQDKKLFERIFQIFQEHQVDYNDQFMIKVCVFILTWRRVMNIKKTYYSPKEENLWKRIYQGLTTETSVLGPVTEDLLPQGLEPNESLWHILQAFTGDSHMNELLGLTIDIFYSLLACARPSIVHPYLTENKEPQVTSTNTQAQQHEFQRETSSSSSPSQQDPGKTVPFDNNTNIPPKRYKPPSPINEEKQKKESRNDSPTSGNAMDSPFIPSIPEPIDNTKAMALSKQQKEKDIDQHPTESSSLFPIIIPTTTKDDTKQYNDNTKKEEKQHQEASMDIPTSTSDEKGKEPIVIDQSTSDQHCIDKFMRPSRTLLSEMIIQYQHTTDQNKEASMLDTIKDLVQHVAQLLDDVDKEENQKTLATQMFYKMIKGYAQDGTDQSHVDSLITSLTKIKLDRKDKVHIITIWKELMILCQKERERKMNQLDQTDVEETSTTIQKKQQEHDKAFMIHPDIMNKMNSLLQSIGELILLHDKIVMEVLHHAGAIIMPYSGGFSHTLTNSAKRIALDIFWDSKRHCPTFDKEKWSKIKRVFSSLCDLFGDFHIGYLETTFDNYDVILDNIQVNLKNAFPKYAHYEIQSKVEQVTEENQFRAGESVDQSYDIASYIFKNITINLDGDYLYKKKTGFPIYMDYGKFHAIVQDIELKIQVITSPKEKSLIVKKSECNINKMKLQFNESNLKFLNNLQKNSFELKLLHFKLA
ncbi:hypothetical protein BDC45DRAFT_594057 [Circinella umbellata]|nr:hypothetical protein BDC45DRAFT_594057 [Circinella umbellata]